MLPDEAKMLAARLIGCYQSRTLDPQIYGVELAGRFLEYTPEEGRHAVEEMLRDDPKIPTVKRVIGALKDARAHLEWKKNPRRVALPKPLEYEGFVGTPEERKIMGGMIGMVRKALARHDQNLFAEIIAVGDKPERWLTFLHEHDVDPFAADKPEART